MNNITKLLLIIMLSLVLFVVFSVAGCQTGVAEKEVAVEETAVEETAVGETAVEDITLGFVLVSSTHPFHVAWANEGKIAGEAYGIKTIWKSAEGKLETQIAAVESLITQGVDVLLVDPVNAEGIVPAIKKAQDAGIPFVVLHNYVPEADFCLELGGHEILYKLTVAMGYYLNGEGKVCMQGGQPGNWEGDQREKGFKDAIGEKFSNIEILTVQPTAWDPVVAQKNAENWLTSYPHIDAIVAATDALIYPTIQVAQNAGRDEIEFFSVDGDQETLDMLKEGTMKADVLLGAKRDAWWQVQIGYKIAKGMQVDKRVQYTSYLTMTDEVADICYSNGMPKDVEYITPEKAIEYAATGESEFGPDTLKN